MPELDGLFRFNSGRSTRDDSSTEPSEFRDTPGFEQVVAGLNRLVATGLQKIEQALETTDDGRIRDTVTSISRELQDLIDKAGAIIHGDQTVLDQVHIDDIMKD